MTEELKEVIASDLVKDRVELELLICKVLCQYDDSDSKRKLAYEVLDGLEVEYFTQEYRPLLEAIRRVRTRNNSTVTEITLRHDLKENDITLQESIKVEDLFSEITETPEQIETDAKHFKEQGAKRTKVAAIERLLADNEGGQLKTSQQINERLLAITQAGVTTAPQTLVEFLDKKYKEDRDRPPNKLLGYELAKFKQIEGNTDGIQPGLYLIAADPNMGKTALLVNLCLDLLDTNQETVAVFFTFDDSKDDIVSRFLALRGNLSINRTKRHRPDDEQERLERAYGEISYLAKAGRLFLYDDTDTPDLVALQHKVRAHSEGKLIVFIDALMDVPTGVTFGQLREQHEYRAQVAKALATSLEIPVLTSVELRKQSPAASGDKSIRFLSDVAESRKYLYKANLAWLLYAAGDSLEKYDDKQKPTMTLQYAKNKLAEHRRTQELEFERSKGIFTEAETCPSIDKNDIS